MNAFAPTVSHSGRSITLTSEHPANALSPTVEHSGSEMVDRLEQPSKQCVPTVVHAGASNDPSNLQLANA